MGIDGIDAGIDGTALHKFIEEDLNGLRPTPDNPQYAKVTVEIAQYQRWKRDVHLVTDTDPKEVRRQLRTLRTALLPVRSELSVSYCKLHRDKDAPMVPNDHRHYVACAGQIDGLLEKVDAGMLGGGDDAVVVATGPRVFTEADVGKIVLLPPGVYKNTGALVVVGSDDPDYAEWVRGREGRDATGILRYPVSTSWYARDWAHATSSGHHPAFLRVLGATISTVNGDRVTFQHLREGVSFKT